MDGTVSGAVGGRLEKAQIDNVKPGRSRLLRRGSRVSIGRFRRTRGRSPHVLMDGTASGAVGGRFQKAQIDNVKPGA
jgi:hypothetical protein